MRTIPFSELTTRVSIEGSIEPVRRAFELYSAGKANVPGVQHLEMPYLDGAALHIKSGHVEGLPFCVVKVASTFPQNPSREPPTPSLGGVIVVFEVERGRPIAVLEDRGWITQIRTAAAGGLAARLLARPDSTSIGVIGSGVQARLQVDAVISQHPGIRRVTVWGRTPANVRRYMDELSQRQPRLDVSAAPSPEAAARSADILVTATYATVPLLRGDALPEGVLVIAMGADSAHKQELDSNAFAQADLVVVDSRSQNLILGEVARGIRSGSFTAERMDAELGELCGPGAAPARSSAAARIICKLTGVAVQEILVCDRLLRDLGLIGDGATAAGSR